MALMGPDGEAHSHLSQKDQDAQRAFAPFPQDRRALPDRGHWVGPTQEELMRGVMPGQGKVLTPEEWRQMYRGPQSADVKTAAQDWAEQTGKRAAGLLHIPESNLPHPIEQVADALSQRQDPPIFSQPDLIAHTMKLLHMVVDDIPTTAEERQALNGAYACLLMIGERMAPK